MSEQNNSRSGLQKAAELAYAARAAHRILQAAAVSGAYGAGIAAVKEALPRLVKVGAFILIALLLIPLVIFSALPNIFFGYASSGTEAVVQMTEQAMSLGGVYLSLEDFEKNYIDAVVTEITAEYEAAGTVIDRIVISNSMKEEDLLWLIATHSVDLEQDLSAMTKALVQDLCKSSIVYTPSLGIRETSDGLVTSILRLEIKRLAPEKLMDDLQFDDDAKRWAGALYETLAESNALDTYKAYFEAYEPDYSGDNDFSGELECGSAYKNAIDISAFVAPDTKNNADLVSYVIQAWENNWGYVWGTYGNVLTPALFDYKKEQYPNGVGNYAAFIEAHWLNRRTADCIGLIKGYGWLDTSSLTIRYRENGMPDYSADQMYQAARDAGTFHEDYGSMESIPEIPGLMLWKKGHVGVYIGNGYVIEAMGTKKGVVKTKISDRGWQAWCKLPYIEYLEVN